MCMRLPRQGDACVARPPVRLHRQRPTLTLTLTLALALALTPGDARAARPPVRLLTNGLAADGALPWVSK